MTGECMRSRDEVQGRDAPGRKRIAGDGLGKDVARTAAGTIAGASTLLAETSSSSTR